MTRKMQFGRMVPIESEVEMWELWRKGLTLQAVGEKFGVTREYVRQILKRNFGLTAKDNLAKTVNSMFRQYMTDKDNRLYQSERRVWVISGYFGCHEELVTYINDGIPFNWGSRLNGSKAGAFINQKRFAAARGIVWDMTFPEWWSVWEDSGKYGERGRRKGNYVMGRFGDTGPYEVNNVYICKCEDNIKDIYKNKTEEELLAIRKKHQKPTCKRGHPLSGENLYIAPKTKYRSCLACQRLRNIRARRALEEMMPEAAPPIRPSEWDDMGQNKPTATRSSRLNTPC